MQNISIVKDGITFHHKDKITCTIERREILDAKIAIEGSGIYICQNCVDGTQPRDRLGYRYAWSVCSGLKDNQVTNVKILSSPLSFKIGTLLIDKNKNKRKILDICQNIYYLSKINKFNQFEFELTQEDMSIAYPN